jgi:tRNA pseudouridine38-40 synthase
MRYFIKLSYKGKNYFGWQRQPEQISVQEVLEEKLSTILRDKIEIVGAGRTDTGVNAGQMYAHFDYNGEIERDNFVHKMNSFLPKDIAIQDVIQVKDDAHARFDASHRAYKYYITTKKDPFKIDSHLEFKYPLDVEQMNKACQILFDYTDFQCFSKSNTDVKTYFCDISMAKWTQFDDELVFYIRADRFLRNMVRAIVGSLLEVGQGKINLEDFKKIIESKNRSNAGVSVPGHALYLVEVGYKYINN